MCVCVCVYIYSIINYCISITYNIYYPYIYSIYKLIYSKINCIQKIYSTLYIVIFITFAGFCFSLWLMTQWDPVC